jgi:hypothetical protein
MVCYDKILHNRRKISNVPRSKHYISLVVYKHKGGQSKLPAFAGLSKTSAAEER